MIEKIQHRGLDSETNPTLPNSFESFRERFGQSMELDVFLLRDGNIVVLHNKDLNLTQEQVEAMSLKEAEEIIIPDREGDKGGRVPLFEEFAFNCLDRGNRLVVEIKGSSPEIAKKLSRKLIERVSRMSKEDEYFLKHPEYVKQVELHSFSIEALEEAGIAQKYYDIELPRGLFWASSPEKAKEMKISATAIDYSEFKEGDDWTRKGIETAKKLGIQSINLHWSVINEAVVKEVHEKGMQIIAWVVNDKEKAKELEQMGVDRIITEN